MIRLRTILTCWLLLKLLPALAASPLPVLPFPQQVVEGKETLTLYRNLQFRGAAQGIQQRLMENWKLLQEEGPFSPGRQVLTLVLDSSAGPAYKQLQGYSPGWQQKVGREGYVLVLNGKEKILAATTETGLFYGLQSLRQLVRAGWNRELVITDWPQFPLRGVYDDISRGPIPQVSRIKQEIERLAELKINSLSFYIEHVVQPPSYPDFAPPNGKLTMEDIRELGAYAAQFHMDLVGSFQSFGHFNNILSIPKYAPMGETSTMISPLDPQARAFLSGVITDLCKAFPSPYFNVNCDETFDLGKGRSKAYVDSVGVAKYYADHMLFLYDVLKKNGKQLMMWGDIALQHEEILDMLPKDIIYLTWEYGDQASYDAWISPFVKRGLRFVVCPGVVNSNRLFPDIRMAKANIRGFLKEGAQQGALGALATVWDDGGMCFLHSDWYGLYSAAEQAWNTGLAGASSFDRRYERNAYGTLNGGYVKAIDKLMELRNLPLTYDLTDQVWTQKILPDSGRTLLMNNRDVPRVLAVTNDALRVVESARPLRNGTDAAYLRFVLEQLKLVMDSRVVLAAKPASSLQGARQTTALIGRYKRLKAQYTDFWNRENQPYWLPENLKVFDAKISGLQRLEQEYRMAERQGKTPPPLSIRVSDADFFDYWLLAGPFPTGMVPQFLYSEDPAANAPPKPGDMVLYNHQTYRWKKWASQDGGIVDLQSYFAAPTPALAYAYSSLKLARARTLKALVGADSVQLFLNGKAVVPAARNGAGETPFLLPLKKGVNHILLKLPQGARWQFSFHLDTREPVTHHKHKYALNDQNSLHDANN